MCNGLIFLISIFGLAGSENQVAGIIQTISTVIPTEITGLLDRVLNRVVQSSNAGLLTFGFIISLWSASNAANIILKSINKTYNLKETRPFWKTRLLALEIVFIVTIVLFISINLIIFGRVILDFIKNFINIPVGIEYTVMLVRWPITFLTLFFMSLFVYYITPNIKDKKRIKILSAIPGSVFFCIFWLLGSWLFSLYVENFANYNETFGFLGGVIVLMTWLYYSSFIILTGGVINSQFYKKRAG